MPQSPECVRRIREMGLKHQAVMRLLKFLCHEVIGGVLIVGLNFSNVNTSTHTKSHNQQKMMDLRFKLRPFNFKSRSHSKPHIGLQRNHPIKSYFRGVT